MRAVDARQVVTTVVAAVVIGAIGVGGWVAWGQHLPLEEATGMPPYGESGRSPVDPLAIAELGGAKENYARVKSLDAVAGLQMLTRDELRALEENGAGRMRLAVSRYDEGKAIVLLVQMPDETAARLATDRLTALQRGYGFRPAGKRSPRGIDAGLVSRDNPAEPGGRAHYRHGDIVARVEFRGPHREPAERKFFAVLSDQAGAVGPDD